ncbi:diguanylate cyclase [Deinococcus sp. SDU3-2]|uniref:Diguanylate cyclase n=1 Tax=Deinococcus terrestris TaxID=2651870 RepID=A0A7X1TRM7_9DEIO|nr:HD domain-containing phosphohydrolase [Deinococcus terrestris]MPY66579.1 diguanylate cyclase [Deinococcus terrestris]
MTRADKDNLWQAGTPGGRGAAPPDHAQAHTRTVPRRWAAALLGLTLLAGSFTLLLLRSAEHERTTLLLLADTAAAVQHHRALTWQAAAPGGLTLDVQGELRECRARLRTLHARLLWTEERERTAPVPLTLPGFPPSRVREGPWSLAPVAAALGRLLEEGAEAPGRLHAARLGRLASGVRAAREDEARRVTDLAAGVSLLALVLTLLTAALLTRRSQLSRLRVEALERERIEKRGREHRDSLTGLLGRRGLARRYGELSVAGDLTVTMLDLNRLRAINDAGGHAAGDEYLRQVARALQAGAGPGGVVARWGGDEFVLLLPGPRPEAARQVAADAQAALRQEGDLPPFAHGTVTVGQGTPLGRALTLADAAMYEDKERQRQALAAAGAGAEPGPTVEDFTARLEALETPQEVVQEGLSLARRLLGFEVSARLECEGERFVARHIDGALEPQALAVLQGMVYREGVGLAGQALLRGTTVWSSDYASEPLALSPWRRCGLKSVVIVPVRSGGRVTGAVGLLNFSSWRVITPQVRRLLEAVAWRLSHAAEQQRAVEEVRHALHSGVLALGVALEARDLETAGHTERVVALSVALGKRLGLGGQRLEALRQGASLHDIGKLSIPDAVLLKPGKLTPEEWAVMQTHAERGAELAGRLRGLLPGTLDVIRSHHEKWDGSGYPDGLAGEAIPLAARVFAICDVYDALTQARPYKRAWTHGEALAELRAQSGRHFDPAVVTAFLKVVETVDLQSVSSSGALMATTPPAGS